MNSGNPKCLWWCLHFVPYLSFLLLPLLLWPQYDFDLRQRHPNTEGPLQLSLSFYEIKSFCYELCRYWKHRCATQIDHLLHFVFQNPQWGKGILYWIFILYNRTHRSIEQDGYHLGTGAVNWSYREPLSWWTRIYFVEGQTQRDTLFLNKK